MSWFQTKPMVARLFYAATAFLCLLTLSGCYTRQIEGIQKDLDLLDRKLHTLNQKSKDVQSTKGTAQQGAIIQLEDRLNEVTLKQGDLQDEMGSLRQNYADLKTTGSPPVGGFTVDKTKVSSLERQVSENNRKTQSMQREMDQLQSTFNSIKGDLRHVIDYVRQDIGEEAPGQTTNNNQVSSTTVEDPSIAVAAVDPPATPIQENVSSTTRKPEKNVRVASASPKTYQVRPRDTLSGIAQKFKVSQDELQRFNEINDPQDIRMGQTIRIP